MKLLGDRNWYLPKWLQWLPKVDVEGHAAAERGRRSRTQPAELVEARDPATDRHRQKTRKGEAARASPFRVPWPRSAASPERFGAGALA
jgi:hypothetical protein